MKVHYFRVCLLHTFVNKCYSVTILFLQAILHEGIPHMACQLGLALPTMNLCSGGPRVELEHAQKNSEAVAKSITVQYRHLQLVLLFTVLKTSLYLRLDIEKKQETILRQMKIFDSDEGKKYKTLEPVFLYVLAPGLPRS